MQHPGSWYLPWGVPLQKMVAVPIHPGLQQFNHPALVQPAMLAGLPAPLTPLRTFVTQPAMRQPVQRKVLVDNNRTICIGILFLFNIFNR